VSDDDEAQAIVGKMRFKSKDFSFYRDTETGNGTELEKRVKTKIVFTNFKTVTVSFFKWCGVQSI
jgi:hypothetical protein